MMKIYNMGVLQTFVKKGQTAQIAVDTLSESEVLRDVCKYLTDNGYFFWRSNNIPVFGRSLPKYTPRGLPDIMVVHSAEFIGIEVKRPDGVYKGRGRKSQLTPDQKAFRDKLTAHGGIYIVVHSEKELDLLFKNKIL